MGERLIPSCIRREAQAQPGLDPTQQAGSKLVWGLHARTLNRISLNPSCLLSTGAQKAEAGDTCSRRGRGLWEDAGWSHCRVRVRGWWQVPKGTGSYWVSATPWGQPLHLPSQVRERWAEGTGLWEGWIPDVMGIPTDSLQGAPQSFQLPAKAQYLF